MTEYEEMTRLTRLYLHQTQHFYRMNQSATYL